MHMQLHVRQLQRQHTGTALSPVDSLPVSQRLREGRAKCQGDVLDSVVVVDPGVSLCLNIDIKQAMGSQLVQHVIEEADWGVCHTLPCAIQVDADLHARFLGLALHDRNTLARHLGQGLPLRHVLLLCCCCCCRAIACCC